MCEFGEECSERHEDGLSSHSAHLSRLEARLAVVNSLEAEYNSKKIKSRMDRAAVPCRGLSAVNRPVAMTNVLPSFLKSSFLFMHGWNDLESTENMCRLLQC